MCRRALMWALRSGNRSESFDYAGMSIMLITVVITVPQFCILTMMDEPLQFTASVLAYSATETAGAIATVRAAHTSVVPEPKREPVPAGGARDTSHCEADCLLAIKVVHEELGEMIGVFVGCGVATWISGWQPATIANACVVVLVEVLSDLVKDRLYMASGIPIGNVRYRMNAWMLSAVVSIGAAGCCLIVASLRLECWVAATS